MRMIVGILVTALSLLPGGFGTGLAAVRTVVRQQQAAYATLREFFRHAAWQQFKRFWRMVGSLSRKDAHPGMSGVDPLSRMVLPPSELTFASGLAARVRDLEDAGLPRADIGFLTDILRRRFWGMQDRSRSRPLARMVMPSPGMLENGKSLLQLERQLGLLDALRGTGKINTAEFDKALAAARRDILAISVRKVVIDAYGEFRMPGQDVQTRSRTVDPVGRELQLVKAHFARLKKEHARVHGKARPGWNAALEKKYRAVLVELELFRKRIPRLVALINDLEQ